MASGYYLAKDLLKTDGIGLERDYKNYFTKIIKITHGTVEPGIYVLF
jgi:hypothetical protein